MNLDTLSLQQFGQPLSEITDSQVFELLLQVVKSKSDALPLNNGKKRLYYISAEFLIGKLLSNNLINLGIYNEVKEQLSKAGHSLEDIEELEVEPSLGNGGLGRLAACFIDSMSTLGLPGDGVGLKYHFGLFHQKFLDRQQTTVPDAWLSDDRWLEDEKTSFTVEFGDFSVTSELYSIDVLGYDRTKKNRLRLFDLQSIDDSLVSDDAIDFDKTALKKNLTLFLYPDDSDEDGQLLRVYQQYFMVSNAAQLILKEAVDRGSNIHDLADYVVIQINDTHPTMVIPELIRILTEKYEISFEESVDIVSSLVAYTNGPLNSSRKFLQRLLRLSKSLISASAVPLLIQAYKSSLIRKFTWLTSPFITALVSMVLRHFILRFWKRQNSSHSLICIQKNSQTRLMELRSVAG